MRFKEPPAGAKTRSNGYDRLLVGLRETLREDEIAPLSLRKRFG